MKLVLILMVRNEEKILQRCLEAVEGVVDAFCIHDTGSTDKTCEIAEEFLKTRKGCLTRSEWKNFGHNRTLSFQAAQQYVKDWDLKTTYGLLLDADMVFMSGRLTETPLTEMGYTVVQCGGNLEYPNCRLARMDYAWTCRGVTHEYWDGPTQALPKSVCYIDDKNDGGCKSDKFERDARLLEQGLRDEPDNVRYMFYLAQTYHSLGRYKDAIAMYKKRIGSGGWAEEVWYSHYMIGQSHKALGNIPKFEEWMLRAHNYRPTRAESIYKLAQHFREAGQHYKAYHYVKLGKTLRRSDDSLFIEKDVYEHLFDYENTILQYYVSSDRVAGLGEVIRYMLDRPSHNVLYNLQYYVKPAGPGKPLDILRDLFGPDYHPSSVCLYMKSGNLYGNIRYVNYRLDLQTRNTYEMCINGEYSTSHTVKTENAHWDVQTNRVRPMADTSVTLPRGNAHIRGLEDVRVFERKDGLYFTATAQEYSPRIRVVHGKYDADKCEYNACSVIESPSGADTPCEKNWLGIPFTDDVIYKWHPLQVGSITGNALNLHTTHTTPSLFSLVRGSAPPFRVNNEWWTLVHFVEYSAPRKYYHMFVVLEADTYVPLRMSLPFVFGSPTVEYCLGTCWVPDGILCVYSSLDDTPCQLTISPNSLHWVKL